MGRGRGRGRSRGRGASGGGDHPAPTPRPGRAQDDGGARPSPALGRQEEPTSSQQPQNHHPQPQQQQPAAGPSARSLAPSTGPPASSPVLPQTGESHMYTGAGRGISRGSTPLESPGGPRPQGGSIPPLGAASPWGSTRCQGSSSGSQGVKTSPSTAQLYPKPLESSSALGTGKMMARAISADDEVKKKGPINFYGLQQPPHRPGLGTKGRHVMVRTNFFPIKIPQFMTVFHYDVTVTPQKLPKRFYRKVYEKFQQMYLGGVLGAYDGSKSSYYAREPIKETCKTFPPFQLALEEGDKPREFTVKLQVVGKLNIDLQRIEQILRDASESMPMIQALDVILRSLPSLRMTPVGRSFFSPPQRPTHLGGGKEVWSGHYQSVRPTMGWKLMLNVDVAATAFYSDQTVFDFLCSILRPGDSASPITDRDRQQFERELNDWERRRFNREIKGLRVVVTHLPYARKYRVLDLTRLSARKQMFPLADGTDCSVENYFKDTYPESVIDHPHLPCLHVGAKDRKVYLPIDVCRIVGGQKCMKKLSDIQTANMIKHTAAPAYRREASIKETVRKAQFNQDKIAKQFDIKVSSEMTEVPSRVLAPPKLNYRGGSSVTPKDGVGAWDMRNGNRFYRGIEVKKWAVVVCPHYCDCKQFIEGLVRQSKEMGMTMTPNPPIAYLGRESIEDVFRRAMESQKGLDLIVVIIDKGGSDYNQVKRLGDTTGGLGVATQCVLSNTVLRKCTPATLGNICLKINARLGGINSVIAPDTLPSIVRDMPIIIFGADVTHPRSEDTTSPSIAAVVASVDLAGSQYRALHNNQKHRQEIIANLKDMVKEHLREFKRRTQQKPVKIIFYRDGVSDGQFNAVILEEVGALQKACLELEHDYQPRITFIVVQKRHHTRFFPKSETEAVGRGKNVPPGTTVDTGITHPSQHDFYLCSHASIQGTSRPCHYHVLWDDSDFSADDLQLFTYQLCHMFWRCNRSVSYPAPTYYAHRDAAHARVLLQAYEDNSSASGGSTTGSDDSRISERNSAIQIHKNREKNMYFM